MQAVLITSNGAWKLGGFGFAISTDQFSNDSTGVQAFHYAEYDIEDSIVPLQPSINYTAPELVRSKTSSVGSSADIFSFGCLAYHLIARKPLFYCNNNVKMYMNSLTYLTSEAFSKIPRELVPDLQRMLSANEASRPTALDFTGSPTTMCRTTKFGNATNDFAYGSDNSGVSGQMILSYQLYQLLYLSLTRLLARHYCCLSSMLSLLSTRSTLFHIFFLCSFELMTIQMLACKRKFSKRLFRLLNNLMLR